MDFTETAINERNTDMLAYSQGGLLRQQAEQKLQEEEQKKREENTEKVINVSPLMNRLPPKDEFDYATEIEEGNTLKPVGEQAGVVLKNKNIKPDRFIVADRDVATGEQFFNKYIDDTGRINEGIQMLNKSSFDTEQGRPYDDAPALGRIASGMQSDGGTFDDYMLETQGKGWSVKARMDAWNAHARANFREEVSKGLQELQKFSDATGRIPDSEFFPEVAPEDRIDPDTLVDNREWLQANTIFYEYQTGMEWRGSAEELTDWGLWQMGLFNSNTAFMAYLTSRVHNGDIPQQWAIMKSMQIYDQLQHSGMGAVRFGLGMATDPTNLLTFGSGIVGGRAAAITAKNAMGRFLVKSLVGAGAAGAEASLFTAMDDAMRQYVEMKGGDRKEYDFGQTGIAAGLGFGLGAAIGGTGGGIASGEAKAAIQEVKELSSSFGKKMGETWNAAIDQLKADVQAEAGYIELRAASKKPIPQPDPEKIVEAVPVAEAMGDQVNVEHAITNVQIMGSMPEKIQPSQMRSNLATEKTVRKLFRGKKISKKSRDWINRNVRLSKKGKVVDKVVQAESPIHGNNKTGLSVDFSTTCPRRAAGKGACAYCYVEGGRYADELYNMKGGNKGFFESPYNGELRDMPDGLVKELNRDGGLRMFSFGDYRPDIDDNNVYNLLEDAKAKGLYIKAITKEPEFVKRYADHPNLRINISIDSMPKEISNSMGLDEALALKAGRENVKIRSVALTREEAIKHAEDPRIDVITLFHSGVTGEKLVALVKAQNPKIFEVYGEEKMTNYIMSWENIGSPSGAFKKEVMKKYPGRFCCEGGKCAKDSTKCGFGVGSLLIIGVHIPDGDVEEDGLTTDEWLQGMGS